MSQAGFDFSDYITHRTRDFVGREWVFAEIDAWLDEPNAPRFFFITGEPGIGKTAVAARLTQIRDLDAHHFCIARQASTIDPLLFTRSLSCQLIRIDGFAHGILRNSSVKVEAQQNIQRLQGQAINLQIKNLVVNASSANNAFNCTVAEPLRNLYNDGFEQQLVILVDALDEAVEFQGRETIVDLLANARDLPSQVRFLLTSRPHGEAMRHFERLEIPHLVLNAECGENLQDIRRYISFRLNESEKLLERLTEHGVKRQAFTERITTASQGNFLYLVRLLPAVANGTQPFDALGVLPDGLDGIYREFLRMRTVGRDIGHWRNYYRPLLGVLAAAYEELDAGHLSQLTGLTAQEIDDSLLDLQQFLDPVEAMEGQYRLYHQSLVDFLSNKEQAHEFWVDLRSVHSHIADHYLNTWGGLESGLTAVQEPESQDLHREYGLRYLANHLAQAEREVDLWSLLVDTSAWRKAQRQYDPSMKRYARNIESAILLSERQGIGSLPQGVAYNLLYATTISQTTNVPAEVLKLMTSLGMVEQALRFAELRTSPALRAKAYLWISEELLAQNCIDRSVEVLELAQNAAFQVSDPGNRGSALSKAAQVLHRAGSKENAREVLSCALESIASRTYGIGQAVIDIAETAMSLDDSEALSRLMPIALDNEEGGSTSRGRFFCRLALALGKGGARNALVHFLRLDPLSRISESKAYTLAWIALGLMLVDQQEVAERLFAQARAMTRQKNDFLLPDQRGENEIELAHIAAIVHLGETTDPVDVLLKAKDLFDGRSEHTQYDNRREHIWLYVDRQEFILDEVIRMMIRDGNLEHILALADLPSLLEFRVELLVRYAKESTRLGNSEGAFDALRRAFQAIDEFTERYFADWGNRLKRLRLVVDAVVELGHTQLLEDALDIADRTRRHYGHTDHYPRAIALAIVGMAWVRCGKKKKAREVLSGLVQYPQSAEAFQSELSAWSEMMLALAHSGDVKRSCEAAEKTMQCAEIIGDCNYVIDELSVLAQGFSKIRHTQGLRDLLSCVKRIEIGDYSRGKILIEIARETPQLDDSLGLKDVIIAASNTGDDGPSALTLVGIAHILAKSGDVDGLLNVAAAAQGIGRYQEVLTTVGLALTRMGKPELSKSILARVKWKEELPNYRSHGKLRSSAYNLVLFNMAQVLALTDQLGQALRLAKDMDTHFDIPELDTEIDKEYLKARGGHPSRDETYVAVARTWLSQADACHDSEGVLQEAIEIVGRIEKATNQFYGLTILARSLSETGRQSQACEVLEAALQTAEAIESSEEQARALITAGDMLGRYVVRRILAHADELTKDIEDVETRVRTSIRLAKITIQIEEPDWAKKIISRLVPDILSRFESVNVFLLTQLADLYIQMEELSSAREILSLASEAIKGSESELDELFLSIIQCRVHCRVGNPGQAQSFATSAIKAFDRCNFFSRSPFKSMCQDKLIELLIEMTDICPQDNLVSVLLDSLDNTRSQGRGVVLEQIGLFAPILEELDVISESWDRIQAIEHCRGSSKLKSFD